MKNVYILLLTTKTKHYESKFKIIRLFIDYSLLVSILHSIIFYTLNYETDSSKET
jgi:hypothetical protein